MQEYTLGDAQMVNMVPLLQQQILQSSGAAAQPAEEPEIPIE